MHLRPVGAAKVLIICKGWEGLILAQLRGEDHGDPMGMGPGLVMAVMAMAAMGNGMEMDENSPFINSLMVNIMIYLLNIVTF